MTTRRWPVGASTNCTVPNTFDKATSFISTSQRRLSAFIIRVLSCHKRQQQYMQTVTPSQHQAKKPLTYALTFPHISLAAATVSGAMS